MSTQFEFNLFKNIIQYKVSILNINELLNHYRFTCYDRITGKIKNIMIHKNFIDNKEDINSVNAIVYTLVYNIRRK